MNRTVILVASISLAFPVAATAQPGIQIADVNPPMPTHQVRSLIKTAHSHAQYRQLAGYFRQREAYYRSQAVAEKIERDRRAQVNASLEQKYPRPVDSANYLYESHLADADIAAAQARHYDNLAVEQEQPDRPLAATSRSKPE